MKLVLEKHQSLYFTSDTHYNHSGICRATSHWDNIEDTTRDFQSLEQMNDTIVNNINAMVGPDDVLVHLGDWSFGGFDKIQEFRNRINCKNIHLVLGNHDEHIEKNNNNIRDIFSSVNHYVNLDVRVPSVLTKGKVDKYKFILMHYPIASWDKMKEGRIHLHGHLHSPKHLRVNQGKVMDVGMDGNDMCPIGLYDILTLLLSQPIKNFTINKDHHQ
jgi:calcineurin-like phosphoesterase family protein